MSLLKYDKAHMNRADGLAGKAAPFSSTPFTFGGVRSNNFFVRRWRALVAPVANAAGTLLLGLFLVLCRVARFFYPNPRFGRLIFVTRDEHVREVLQNSETFGVPYTPEMIELAGGVNSILGMDGREHDDLSKLIGQAMRDVPTATGQSMNALIKSQSANVANALLDNSAGRIDVIQDLFTRTLTETTCTYFGLKVDDPVEFAHWTMAFSRLLFGDPLGNASVRAEAMNAAPRLGLVIDQAIFAAKAASNDKSKTAKKPEGLIRALVDLQNTQKNVSPSEQLSDARIRATVIGLIVALIPTNTLAAGNMLEELLHPKRRAEWRKAISLAKADDDEALRDLLLEAGRLRPALSPGLWRYVKQEGAIAENSCWWNKCNVYPNDLVLAVIPSALRDRRAYPRSPHAFNGDRSQYPDLMFGHGPHFCIGDRLAMIQITQIFKALLAREPELATRKRKAESIGPFPVRLDMKFSPDRTESTMIIITMPTARCFVNSYENARKEIDDAIKALGNPATGEIGASLTRTGLVHFASLSVVEAGPEHGKPPIIIFEINADGPRDDVLRALVHECSEWLTPIFCFVTDRVKREPGLLLELLRLHARELRCSPFDPLGLHFNGMRQFSVNVIERQAKLAKFARKALDEHLKSALGGVGRAADALSYVREQIRGDSQFSSDLLQPSRNTLDIAEWREPRSFTGPFFRKVLWQPAVRNVVAMFVATWFVFALTMYCVARIYLDALAEEGIVINFLASGWSLFAVALGSLLAAILLAAFVIVILVLGLTRREKADKSEDRQADLEKAKQIAAIENRAGQAQNHIIAVMPLKHGWFRRMTLAFSLWGIKQSMFWFRPGFVVTMGTIHYAKWFVIPGTNQFVFLSNYDGSWENYLEDFITRAHEGQSAAWSNGVGFPKTRWLIRYGAEDGDRFKRWVRNQQRPTPFWYCRFPELTAEQIRKNALIHNGLVRATTSTESRAWLSTFGSEQRQANEIEADEVQSLVFSGQPQSQFMTCLLLHVPDNPEDRAQWLRGLTGQVLKPELQTEIKWLKLNKEVGEHLVPPNLRISFGDHDSPAGATFLAFTAAGLCQFGLQNDESRSDQSGIESFPPVFRMGMVNRSNVLGDRGPSDPANWRWHDANHTGEADERPVEAALLIYGPFPESDDEADNDDAQALLTSDKEEKDFRALRSRHRRAVNRQIQFLTRLSGAVVRRVETGPNLETWKILNRIKAKTGDHILPIEREHFGFADGISQPAILGTSKAASRPASRDIVSPGEFILGYRNNQDYFPPALTVRASDDLQNKLPTISANTPLRFPYFGSYATASDDDRSAPEAAGLMRDYRDFGRNGTYLVLRDLEQDVEGFQAFTKNQADALNTDYPYISNIIGREIDAKWVAAKMVGRWQNGAPLVGNPNRPPRRRRYGTAPENDFSYGSDDPRGLQCPLGAHIRRTNPRDSLQPGDSLEQAITNRHRLVRRGRSYVNGGALRALPVGDKGGKGMIFACICADLERQFEFVQQSWANAASFHGLNREPDPLIGAMHAEQGDLSNVFSIPTPGGAITMKNMQSYVTTRAGGYFFMPSRSALLYLATKADRSMRPKS